MKIGFYSVVGDPWGGSEVLWVAAANEALDSGHQVVASVFHWPEPAPDIARLQARGADFVFRRRFYPALPKRLAKRLLNILPLKKTYTYNNYFLRHEVDIIHFSLSSGLEIALDKTDLFQFVRELEIPYTVHCHELWGFSLLNSEIQKRQRMVFDSASAVFFTSKFAAREVEKSLGCHFANIEVPSHPLHDTDRLSAMEWSSSGTIRLGMLGALDISRKGQDIALRALALDDLRHQNWLLDIYGNGPHEDQLRSLVERLCIQEKVKFHRKSDDLANTIAAHDVFLFPSLSDTGPITLVECMLAGKVTVSNPLGLAHDLVEDSTNGFLSDDFNSEAFAAALRRCLSRWDALEPIGREARETIRQNYDLNPASTMIKRLVQLVDDY